MSPADRLRTRIAIEGPLTVAAFMTEVLAAPGRGYYMRQDPLGSAGDFTTAPEISQMFGELLGLWLAQAWNDAGAPDPVHLVELGPGRGTLMADAWRAMRAVSGLHSAARVHLVEISPALRDVQRRTLNEIEGLAWHDDLSGVPDGPLLLVANEFFDALPIHQFVRTAAGWRERRIDAAAGAFHFVLDRHVAPRATLLPTAVRDAEIGAVAEICPAAISVATEVGRRIATLGGAAIIVDYGPAKSEAGDTLQSVHRHRSRDPLTDPGEADLTAHVDFATLVRATTEAGAVCHGPVPQGTLLRRIGIEARAHALRRRATSMQARAIESALDRLIAPDQMGTLFKALAISKPGAPVPPGFEQSSTEESDAP